MTKRLISTYILSLLDLVFTLILINLGASEVNPIGQALLANPIWAVLYKAIAVGFCLGTLYLLRRNKLARIASWGCLIAYAGVALYHIGGLIYAAVIWGFVA